MKPVLNSCAEFCTILGHCLNVNKNRMQWFANLLNSDFIHSKSQNVEFVILYLMATTNLHHQKEEIAQHQFSFFSFFFHVEICGDVW